MQSHKQGKLALVLGSLTAFGPLSIDMYLPSLPTIERELHTSTSATQLTLASFFAGLGVAQLAYGPLADRFGRKRPLYGGLVLYILASAGCALAPTIGALVVLRFLQAAGGAAGMVVSRAVVRDLYTGQEAARLLSLLMLVMGAAPILAPMIGAAILAASSWRFIFALLAVFGVACLVAMIIALPETSKGRPAALNLGPNVRILFRDPAFVTYTFAGAFGQAGMFAYISGSPFVLIQLLHLTPTHYGWAFGMNAFGLISASQINRRLLARRTPATLLCRATIVTSLAGIALVVTSLVAKNTLLAVLSSLFVFVGSLGFVGPNATALAMDAHGPRAGLASAVLGSSQFAVSAVASSLVGLLFDGTMRPMAFVMATCASVAWILAHLGAARGSGSARGGAVNVVDEHRGVGHVLGGVGQADP
ncbi:Multidrug resistance transporter, Bcr/CflA family [Labilithrix luteola]|uniref:Multidrug resistance transporter, Bcr/CflA family n=1 Tax=Labilithrix luteola TaxID=1391654 RepID=A0A0K1Q536_9BACT|nr:multidrug effflux MFS transporter [Labilithrix luteola]AKV00762.1 Multidrug resistance transporter, Bcr/CflA family [Labilithrix luteola]